ncbi:hypothetical protein K1T71_007798 [Dendrolimus kikuchii]|uniref:Uncharacterized protein n=1 Tax=Dendrolimus kikuchii TaxID=765133 RepID=A0ACC1CYP5_9NEOP|nr:hypothetical protein K1T71_007798 [Dendrolimus kikuchii]
MVLTKEYRICMPMTVEEYRIGQLYMIARHSFEQSSNGEGVEVVANEEITDEINGVGQFTEKRIHLSSHLPYWLQSMIPKIFYITEKAWNYYPYTITEELEQREVDFLDIAYDEIKPHHYKEAEDPKFFKSEKTGRGPLIEGWRDTHKPVMCCYKSVSVKFEVWGLQTRVEEYAQGAIREILLLGHRQAFAWMDEWYNMTIEDVRDYERDMQAKTNIKLKTAAETAAEAIEDDGRKSGSQTPRTPRSPKSTSSTPTAEGRTWFNWS